MKLQCLKCGRQIEVLARDVRELNLNIEPWSNDEAWWQDVHLSCPFCVLERGGTYWLARRPKKEAA